MKEYNVHEILAILQKYYITDSLQMVTRWIREGKIQGIRSEYRKDGYRVSEEELFEFIDEQRPGLPSIMKVYEEYIKKLSSDHHEKTNYFQSHEEIKEIKKLESKKMDYEKEITELRKKLITVENMLIDFEQEKQIIEMNLIEIMEQKNSLVQENEMLFEENKTLNELYGIIDEENKQLKRSIIKPSETEETSKKNQTKTDYPKEDTNQQLVSFEQFLLIGNDSVSNLHSDFDETIMENHLRNVYKQLFDEDGSIKNDLLAENGAIKCPFTQREYKQQKRLINNAIKFFFEDLNKKEQKQELMNQ
jgi:hypothetical protein